MRSNRICAAAAFLPTVLMLNLNTLPLAMAASLPDAGGKVSNVAPPPATLALDLTMFEGRGISKGLFSGNSGLIGWR